MFERAGLYAKVLYRKQRCINLSSFCFIGFQHLFLAESGSGGDLSSVNSGILAMPRLSALAVIYSVVLLLASASRRKLPRDATVDMITASALLIAPLSAGRQHGH